MKEFIIQKNEENQRFDKYLKKLLPNATTSFLYKMMRKKNIVINKKKAEGNEKLVAGDVISIFLSDETFEKFHANLEELQKEYNTLKSLNLKGLKVVYEDTDMIVADKPYNMLSQKATDKDLSANEYLLGYMINKGELSFEEFQTFRPSVVNRLDRNTTGLLLFGKTLNGLQELGENIRNRSIEKYYRAIVAGELKEELELKGYLLKDEKTNKVSYHSKQIAGADYIETGVKPIVSRNGLTLVEIHLITGKTHQIRLHLSTIGHPIVGDMKYGDEKINKKYYESHKVNHQLLHAYRLEFPDGRVIKAEPAAIYSKLLEK
ncbi:MAG: RluA family pseudouridine synthase [Agathobacter sp.]|nr:RluA family pseudouridine synthase [Agathobacter sp.]